MRAHREAWHAAGDSQEEKVRCLGHVARAKGTTANTIVEGNIGGKDHEEGQQESC